MVLSSDSFHVSSGTTLAHSGVADDGKLIFDIDWTIKAACAIYASIIINNGISFSYDYCLARVKIR